MAQRNAAFREKEQTAARNFARTPPPPLRWTRIRTLLLWIVGHGAFSAFESPNPQQDCSQYLQLTKS